MPSRDPSRRRSPAPSAGPDDRTARHPIRVVSRRTGIRQDLLRAWERRYGVVSPDRSATRRRLYSDRDIARLLLIRRALDDGRSIGQLARLSDEEIASLLQGDAPAARADDDGAERALRVCDAAVRRLDGPRLASEVGRAADSLGLSRLLGRVLVPLLESVGGSWERGELLPAHEHLASAVIRTFLGTVVSSRSAPPGAPRLVAATLPDQRHELGVLMAATLATTESWGVTYLGPELPPRDLAVAVDATSSRAVLLSVTVEPSEKEHAALRAALPAGVAVLVGGRARATVAHPGIQVLPDLAALPHALELLAARGGDLTPSLT